MSSAGATYFDNPASTERAEEGVPQIQVAMRETGSGARAGFMMLVPPHAPRYLLVPNQVGQELQVYDLLRPDGRGAVVLHGDEMYVYTAALSADGESVFLGCNVSGLHLYDTAQLLKEAAALLDGGQTKADDQIAPRGRAPNVAGQTTCVDAVFSHDATRLFVLWKTASEITVHDASHPELLVLRTLPFNGNNFQYSNFQLACAGGVLAASAGGGWGSGVPPSSSEEQWMRRQVKVWRVGVDGETDLWTVSQPDEADSVAVRHDGGLLAVGLRNGVVRILSLVSSGDIGEREVLVEHEPLEKTNGETRVTALCFSRDGTYLVAGRTLLDDFVVYDVVSAAVVARFVQKKSNGFSVVFSPAGDMLVTGGEAVQPCVLHRLRSPAPRVALSLSSCAEITANDIISDDIHGSVVAMISGSQLEVHTEGGKVLLQHDFGEQMFTSLSNMARAVRLHPGFKFVACVLAKKIVVVVSIADGSELLRFSDTGGSCFGTQWSQDGALLATLTIVGTRVFSVATGFAQVAHLDSKQTVFSGSFDSTSTRLATSTMSGRMTIWDVATWAPTHEFEGYSMVTSVCFSHKGDRLAFMEVDDHRIGVLALGAETNVQVVAKHVNAATAVMFSPDDRFLLCCPCEWLQFDQHRMRVIDLATGADAEWGELLRTMALPVAGGVLSGRTLGWAQLSHARSLATDTTGRAPQWVLYAAVGKRFVAVDVQAALHAIHDNAWTVEQLTFCGEHQLDCVGSMLEAAPHCSSIRSIETGETVLHRLARMHNADLMQKWLEQCPQVTPVANAQGHTAVEVAMQLEQADLAQVLWSKLTPSITFVSASLVMQELTCLSSTHPHLVRPFLLDVEPKVVRTLAKFRTELTRAAEVCGLPTVTLAGSGSDNEATSKLERATDSIPSVWLGRCPADSPKTLVASRVLLLPHMLGDAEHSPLHAIVANCDASVFESKLLQLVVQHKWEENVSSQRLRSIAMYGFAFVIGALAMVSSVTNAVSVAPSTVDALQGLVVLIEVSSLGVEAFELAREGCSTYFSGPWNVLDVLSSGLLLFASVFHLVGAVDVVRTAGALGVALKCFGMVDYLRSYPATGSLVRMISVIMTDMVPFMTILSSAMLGCMLFFTINLSSNPDFESDSGLGLFRTLVTVYHMTLGIGTGIDTEHASVMTVVVVTLFMSFVVVILLNLLIAIMGDSYEKVKESERLEAIRERARIIVEQEKWFPRSHRYHRYMHFVEAVDTGRSAEREWEGVTNRVSQLLDLKVNRLEQHHQELDGKIAELSTQLNSKIDNKFELLESKLEIILDKLK